MVFCIASFLLKMRRPENANQRQSLGKRENNIHTHTSTSRYVSDPSHPDSYQQGQLPCKRDQQCGSTGHAEKVA